MRVGVLTYIVWGLAATAISLSAARAQGTVTGLIPDDAAARHGLERAWAGRLSIDSGRDTLQALVLREGSLLAQSRNGVLQLFDAETGRTLWKRQVGRRDLATMPAAMGSAHVAVPNGRMLYVIDRASGRDLWQYQIEGVPSAAPAISASRVYVPTQRGRMTTLRLDDPDKDQWFVAASGAINAAPVVTTQSLLWSTGSGTAFSGELDKLNIRWELITGAGIAAPLAAHSPLVYVASRDHYLYAVDELTGIERWRHAADSGISQAPVVVGELVFILPERGGMICLDAGDGRVLWRSAEAAAFVAASPTRVYAETRLGEITVLDRSTGRSLDRIATSSLDFKFANTVNDRLYLGTGRGLLQCLHERELPKPAQVSTEQGPAPAGDDGTPDASDSEQSEEPATDDSTADDSAAEGDFTGDSEAAEPR